MDGVRPTKATIVGSLSEAIDCSGRTVVGIRIPGADWDAADLTFQALTYEGGRGPARAEHVIRQTDGTSGSFDLDVTVDGGTLDTATIAYDDTVAEIGTALAGLDNVDAGDFTVTIETETVVASTIKTIRIAWKRQLEFSQVVCAVDGASLTGGTVALETYSSGGVDGAAPVWLDVYDAAGNEVSASADSERHIVMSPDGLRSARWLRVRSGTSDTPAAQSVDVPIEVILVDDEAS